MNLSKRRIIKFLIMLFLLACMLFANLFAVRAMLRYGVEVYFYDKLQVALNIAGVKGLDEELAKIRATEKLPRVLKLTAEFDAQRNSIPDLDKFLENKVEQGKKKVETVRNLRSLAIILITLAFCWQLLNRWLERRRCKGK
ncbi:MAG: hypothetical protein NT088_04480 [Candidatus Omnitrophica bacterium]|nr:hypothetical protein [Candidatus Omnitrophota bacterium]